MESKFLKFVAVVFVSVLVYGAPVMAAGPLDHSGTTATQESMPGHSVDDSEGNAQVIGLEGAEAAAEHAAPHQSAGLPQMDAAWFPSQIFWLFVTFTFLYTVFSKKVLPEISATLEGRRTQIQEDLDFAQNLKQEAEKTHQAYEDILAKSRNESSVMFAKLDEDVKKRIADRYEAFQESSQAKIQEMEAALEGHKKEALSEMQGIAAEVASMAANKIIGIAADVDQARTLIKNISKKAA